MRTSTLSARGHANNALLYPSHALPAARPHSRPPPPARAQAVPEADRRVYTYKGVCLARANKGSRSWFKLYNVFPDVGGFVQHFPL